MLHYVDSIGGETHGSPPNFSPFYPESFGCFGLTAKKTVRPFFLLLPLPSEANEAGKPRTFSHVL